jgi:shikimate dehydrogenase
MSSSALQEIIALLGCPAAGHPGQYLFERAIEEAGLDWRFLTLEVALEQLAAALAGVAAMGFRGCILSGPLRAAALPLVASATPSAAFAGAVGLVDRQATGLVGHMTDGRGVMEALRSHTDPSGGHVLLLGAGAAARAVALELALARCAGIVVADRTPERAAALVESIATLEACPARAIDWQPVLDIPSEVSIVVSALPVSGHRPPVEFTGMRSDMVVADLPLVAQPSPLVALASGVGACVIDGLEIHCEKVAIDFHTWTGIEPDVDMLREALDEFFSA